MRACAPARDADPSPSRRWLYDLSREVQDIVRVLKSTEDAQAARVRELEYVLRDWNEVFAEPNSALQGAGVTRGSNGPVAVARRIVALAESERAKEAEIGSMRASMDRETADLRAALRDGTRIAREEAGREMRRLRSDAEDMLSREAASKAAVQSQLDALTTNLNARVEGDVGVRVAEQTRVLRSQITALKGQLEQVDAMASTAARTAERDADRLRLELDMGRDEMASMAKRHAEAFDIFTAVTGREAREARAEAEVAGEELRANEEGWRAKYSELAARWEHSTAAVRVRDLEAAVTFYRGRARELEGIAGAMQSALAGVASASASTEEVGPVQASTGSSFEEAVRCARERLQSKSGAGRRTRPTTADGAVWARAGDVGPARPLAAAAVVRHAAVDALGLKGGPVPTETRYYTARGLRG